MSTSRQLGRVSSRRSHEIDTGLISQTLSLLINTASIISCLTRAIGPRLTTVFRKLVPGFPLIFNPSSLDKNNPSLLLLQLIIKQSDSELWIKFSVNCRDIIFIYNQKNTIPPISGNRLH